MKTEIKQIAFTLVEILLVLAIIGITATLTIPNLKHNYDEEVTIARLRKAQVDLNRAYASAVAKYGEYELWGVSDSKKAARLTEFLKGRECSTGSTHCWPDGAANGHTVFELEDGTVLDIFFGSASIEIAVAPFGSKNGYDEGKTVFAFNMSTKSDSKGLTNCTEGSNLEYPRDTFIPQGYCQDVKQDNSYALSVTSKYFYSNWAVFNGNLDYNKCPEKLNWIGNTTCQ
ncbi:type II secretion system protein [bacterium]|nr:type II secretion system protein [bacterium]